MIRSTGMKDSRWILIATVAGLLTGGCQQQMARIFYRSRPLRTTVVEQYVALAADVGDRAESAPAIAAPGPSTRPCGPW